MTIGGDDDLISVRDMRRSFRRRGDEPRTAVRDLNLSVGRGQVVALLGPNGAGKTTTVRVCATLLTPTSGSVRIAGNDVMRQTRQARRNLGLVLGGERGFYARASALENLRYFADLAMVSRRDRDKRISTLLERVRLADRANDRVETYSRGMRQRLHIARALLADPPVILMDEPTIGLDPEAAIETRGLIRELSHAGKAILLTTHYLYEAQELADEINVIAAGRLLVTGRVEQVARAAGAGSVTTLVVDAIPARVVRALRDVDGVAGVEVTGGERVDVTVLWRTDHADEQAVTRCVGEWRPRAVTTRPATLEEAYLALLARDRANVSVGTGVR